MNRFKGLDLVDRMPEELWTRNQFKKIGDTKGAFHVKMGTIKDRNSSAGIPSPPLALIIVMLPKDHLA